MVVARAEMTRRVGHGERYLHTRVFLADGRVMQHLNPGVSDPDDTWGQVGTYTDLGEALREARRDGWKVIGMREIVVPDVLRTFALLVTLCGLVAIGFRFLGLPALVLGVPVVSYLGLHILLEVGAALRS